MSSSQMQTDATNGTPSVERTGENNGVANAPMGNIPMGNNPVADNLVGNNPIVSDPVANNPVGSIPIAYNPLGSHPIGRSIRSLPIWHGPDRIEDNAIGNNPIRYNHAGNAPVGNYTVADNPVGSSPLAITLVDRPATPQDLADPVGGPAREYHGFYIMSHSAASVADSDEYMMVDANEPEVGSTASTVDGEGDEQWGFVNHPNVDDGTQSYDEDSDMSSSTSSVESNAYESIRQFGRTYQRYREGKYLLPNDPEEFERLDLQHNLFNYIFDRFDGFAPPHETNYPAQRVLDVGSGSGSWAVEYAVDHPNAIVKGVDLSPAQGWAPDNLSFIIDDVEDNWGYNGGWDFIHSRMMNGHIRSWSDYLRNIYKSLEPGGWVEIDEMDFILRSDDNTLPPNGLAQCWVSGVRKAHLFHGRPFVDTTQLSLMLLEHGFTEIVERRFKFPMNRSSVPDVDTDTSDMSEENTVRMVEVESLKPLITYMDWTEEQARGLTDDVTAAIRDQRSHAYWPVCNIIARKPLNDEPTDEEKLYRLFAQCFLESRRQEGDLAKMY